MPDAESGPFLRVENGEATISPVQAIVRKRILRIFVVVEAKSLVAYAHGGGFYVDMGLAFGL